MICSIKLYSLTYLLTYLFTYLLTYIVTFAQILYPAYGVTASYFDAVTPYAGDNICANVSM